MDEVVERLSPTTMRTEDANIPYSTQPLRGCDDLCCTRCILCTFAKEELRPCDEDDSDEAEYWDWHVQTSEVLVI